MASLLPPAAQPAHGESKLQQVERLLSVLRTDLVEQNLSTFQRTTTLEKLKVFVRDPRQCDPIFTKEGIELLGKHGFIANGEDTASTREALRCLANALLVAPNTRQTFVDLGFPEKAAIKFASDSVDDEFLLARILFLITYNTTLNLKSLLKNQNLQRSVENALSRHAKAHAGGAKSRLPSQMDDMALSETLKLVFNISYFVDDKIMFRKLLPDLFRVLALRDLPPFPLQPPITLLINAILNMDLAGCMEDVFPTSDPLYNVKRLVHILDKSTGSKSTKVGASDFERFDENGAPIISLLRGIIEISPDDVKVYLKSRLLPSEEERNQPLGKGTTLAARLLQLSSSASAPNTKESISYILFELSGSNAEELIRNIGYGYASGILATYKIPVPASSFTLDPASTSSSKPVNPITGQALESEPIKGDLFEEMTEEEKEREAERLFVLFERLNKTGVVNVKNPVEQAVEEGRFEELNG